MLVQKTGELGNYLRKPKMGLLPFLLSMLVVHTRSVQFMGQLVCAFWNRMRVWKMALTPSCC